MVLMFWPTLLLFPRTWDAPSREHGWMVLVFAAWLIWRDRRALRSTESDGLLEIVPILAILSMTWLIAVIAGVGSGHQTLMPIILALWALATLGWAARSLVAPILAIFMLAVPIWDSVIPLLQRLTTIVSGGATRLVGIEAEVGYDTIALTLGTFLVEAGCSGLNYLMGALVLGAMYAELFVDRWQTKAKIVAIAALASVVGNWIRVTMLIVIGEVTAMQSPLLEDHLWQGWWIFTLLMIPTYFIARKIERRDAAKFRTDGAAQETSGPLSVDAIHARNRRALIAGGAAIIGPLVYMSVGALPRSDAVDTEIAAVRVAPSWRAEPRSAIDISWVPAYRGVDRRTVWTLRARDAAVEATRHHFEQQRFGEELIQFGNVLAPDSLVFSNRIVGPVGESQRFVREAIVFDDRETARVVWYWYRVGGFDTAFETKAKLLEVVAFFRRTPAAELVTLTATCAPGDCTAAANSIRSAMGVPLLSADDDRAGRS